MADLLDVVQKLQDTEAALAKARAIAAKHPKRPTLKGTINSLNKRQRILQKEFARLTEQEQIDVCSYRLIAQNPGDFTLWALTAALGDFQDAVALIYDAIKSGQRKERASWGADVSRATAFNFSYA